MIVISNDPSTVNYSSYNILQIDGQYVYTHSSNLNSNINYTNNYGIAVYDYQNIKIMNYDSNKPSLLIEKRDSENIIIIYDNTSNICFNISSNGYLGINKYASDIYEIDINGITNAILFRGNGSNLNNINLNDRTTSLLKEGSNLYYTTSRVNSLYNNILNNSFTDTLSEGSNLYYTQHRVDTSFDNNLTQKTTSQLVEGSNLYYTQSRIDTSFDIRLNTKTTIDLSEGSNLYYTNNRFVNDFNYLIDENNLLKSTSYTPEGSNLYYTFERVDNPFKTTVSNSSSDNISEGSNLYYTQNRADKRILDIFTNTSQISTSQIKEGSNLYYTEIRTDKRIKENRPSILSLTTSSLKEGSNLYYTNLRVDTILLDSIPSLSSASTSLLPQGSNLYYTNTDIIDILNHRPTSYFYEGSNLYYKSYRTNNDFDYKLNIINTDYLNNGTSNVYYTNERFNYKLSQKTTDNLNEGVYNRFIINDAYDTSLTINGTLTTSNLNIIGSNILFKTPIYITDNIQVINISSGPALNISQYDTDEYNILDISQNNISILSIDNYTSNEMNIGIKSSIKNYDLDVNGTVNAKKFRGNGMLLNNITLTNNSTSDLSEGSNLYYTDIRLYNNFDSNLNLINTNYLNEGSSNIYYTVLRNITTFDNRFVTRTTSYLEEGNQLYYKTIRLYNDFDNKLITVDTNFLYEGNSNIYYTNTRADNNFDIRLNTKTTPQLEEGYSLYYNTNRFNNVFDTKTGIITTSLLSEGSSNIYYTTNRLDNNFDNKLTTKTTSELAEGSNLYYTTLRNINNFNLNLTLKTTDNLLEGSNLYYTQDRTDNVLYNRLSIKTSSQLSEGSNLYYTLFRVNSLFDNRLKLKDTDYLLNGMSNIYYYNDNYYNDFDNRLIIKNTDDLLEGYNIYYKSSHLYYNFDNHLTTKTTDDLIEGNSNLYYTTDRFDTHFNSKTTDFLLQGSNNKYIVNDIYNDSINVSDTVIASNLYIIGSNITINTPIYLNNYLNLINSNSTALNINNYNSDILNIYDTSNSPSLSIISDGLNNMYVGVNIQNPQYNLDVNGIINSLSFKGSGYLLYNVNIIDRNTSQLAEGSNLYYTTFRLNQVFDIKLKNKTTNNLSEGSNVYYNSNYVYNVFDYKLDTKTTNNLLTGSNLYYTTQLITNDINTLLSSRLQLINTDNIIEGSSNIFYRVERESVDFNNRYFTKSTSQLKEGSNIYYKDAYVDARVLANVVKIGNVSTNVLKEGSNLYYKSSRTNNDFDIILNNSNTSKLSEGSNLYYTNNRLYSNFDNKLITKNTDNFIEGSSNIYWTINRFDSRLSSKTSDNLQQGIHNKYIIDNTYNGSLIVNSIVITSNINVINKLVNFENTQTYSTENLNIVSQSNICLTVYHNNSNDIVKFYNNIGVKMIITSNNNIGINTSLPKFDVDVNGTINSSFYKGDANLITNVNIIDKNTSYLSEGSNLYYTSQRYYDNFDNRLNTLTTNNIKEGSNLYYTTQRFNLDFDVILNTKTTSLILEGSNLYYTLDKITSNIDSKFNTKTTNNFKEGSNLYYTLQRFNTDLNALINTKTTSIISEGSNLYYTIERINDNFDTKLSTKNTNNLNEGSNIYYTTLRFNTNYDTILKTKSTSQLYEGSNLYYTTQRYYDGFDLKLSTKNTNNFKEGSNLYYTTVRLNSDIDNRLNTKTTNDLIEGSNLYYTNYRSFNDFDYKLTTKNTNELNEIVVSNLFYNDTTNLISWYKCDGSSSLMLNDSSGNFHTLVPQGAPTFNSTSYKTGNGSMSLSANNGTCYSGGLTLSTSITICCWIYINGNQSQYFKIFSMSKSTTPWRAINLQYSSGSGNIWDVSCGTYSLNVNFSSYINVWFHFAVTISSTGMFVYINGNQSPYVSKTTGIVPIDVSAQYDRFCLGGWRLNIDPINDVFNYCFTGLVDDFRLYNRVLTTYEISIIYNKTVLLTGSNLYYTTNRYLTDFDSRLNTKITSDLVEGSNLYYTPDRLYNDFDNKLLTKTTNNLIQTYNLYYTTSNLNSDFDSRLKTKTTSDLIEGSNIYYTNDRLYNDFDNKILTKNTNNFKEGSNLYYNSIKLNTDIDNKLKTKKSSDLNEGSNLYYLNTRLYDNFDNKINTISTNNLKEGSNLYYTTVRLNNDIDTRIKTKTTSELLEGSNIYYTTNRAYTDFDDKFLTKTTNNLNYPYYINLPISSGINVSPLQISNTDYTYASFTSTTGINTITFLQDTICDILLVAGGGAGGFSAGGGGGAGGVIYETSVSIPSGTYNIIVGKGGIPATTDRKGQNSSFYTYTAIGGGCGEDMSESDLSIKNGGSGGGGQRNNIVSFGTGGNIGGTSISGQGYNGGQGKNFSGFNSAGGGGGGAGSVGSSAFIQGRGGDGGIGRQINITGTNIYYGGGGGGGSASDFNVAGTGGLGGGGAGSITTSGSVMHVGGDGINGLGGGGGGGSSINGNGLSGGYGGSGIVIIKWNIKNNVNSSNVYYTTTKLNNDFDDRLKTKITSDLTEGSNLYYTTNRLYNDFDDKLITKTTNNLKEGSNIYYTTNRLYTDFDNRLTTKTTSQLLEDSNIYYTNNRFYDNFDYKFDNITTNNLKNYTQPTIQGFNINVNTANNNYYSTVFTSNIVPNSITFYDNTLCDIILVGGGGGGSENHGGGGGAGGIVVLCDVVLMPGTYNITIGEGGAGGIIGNSAAGKGGNTYFHTLMAEGGGGAANTTTLKNGGSGAGGDAYSPMVSNGLANIPIASNITLNNVVGTYYGNNGGNYFSDGTAGCGGSGGGAGEAGKSATKVYADPKQGGNGIYQATNNSKTINFKTDFNLNNNYGEYNTNNLYFGGGGGNGTWANTTPTTGGLGGIGGGGMGGRKTLSTGVTGINLKGDNGLPNSGGGGGGGGDFSGLGGSGGSGIVIIRWKGDNSANMYYTSNLINTDFDKTLKTKSTSELIEGSNIYYTTQRLNDDFDNRFNVISTDYLYDGSSNFYNTDKKFDTRLSQINADYLTQGTSNKYIVNNIYNGYLTVNNLTTSNLNVLGDNTILNTPVYTTNSMQIINQFTGPALYIQQYGSDSIFKVFNNNNPIFSITGTSNNINGSVGIKTMAPKYDLDINGTIRASLYIGNAYLMSNININDRTTSLLSEGSNLYYLPNRLYTDFDDKFITKTTDNLNEGSNLYYTSSRLNTDFDKRLKTTVTSSFIEGSNLYYTNNRLYDDFDYKLTTKNTDYLIQNYITYHPTIVGNGTSINYIGDNYYYTSFTSTTGTNSITFSNDTVCDVFMIGGGGSGGNDVSGGGGAGACIVSLGYTFTAGTYNVVVGAGGTAVANTVTGNSGGDTTIGNVFRAKGGGGGGYSGTAGNYGGCSGGVGGFIANTSPNVLTTNVVNGNIVSGPTSGNGYVVLGNKGGNGVAWDGVNYSTVNASGGGGIGGVGATSTRTACGVGGNGVYQVTINGTTYNLKNYFSANTTFGVNSGGNFYIGGGGAGGGYESTTTTINGGLGGGGTSIDGPGGSSLVSGNGANNTGSGGGGGTSNGGIGGAGGSGIVIIRWKKYNVISSNLYYTSSNLNVDFDNRLKTKITTQLQEGSNLYYTTNRLYTDFDDRLLTKTTNDLVGASYIIPPILSGTNVIPTQIANTDYYYAAFTSITGTNSITFSQNTICDILLVGGGGGGGCSVGSGGGAGGLIYKTSYTFPSGTYNITVGDGGIGHIHSTDITDNNGKDTFIKNSNNVDVFRAFGGGGGLGQSIAFNNTAQVRNGGSGGGGVRHKTTGGLATQIGVDNYGNNGGNGSMLDFSYGGGGGGGAGSAGFSATSSYAGNGGNGKQINIRGVNEYFAAGGGGAANLTTVLGSGGSGIGGNGAVEVTGTGYLALSGSTSGVNFTGSGGGGGAGSGTFVGGSRGGSGIVIIRWNSKNYVNGSNLYYTTERLTNDFDITFKNRTTSQLIEGSNLYYLSNRLYTDFDNRLTTKDTNNLKEGSNLYYTTSRLNNNFDTRLKTKTNSLLTEGSNLYYTSDRLYIDFDDRLTTKSTDNLKEGSNLYYTSQRLNNDFDNKLYTKTTTSHLSEGSNLYYTSDRLYNDFDDRLTTKSTDNLNEGSNLYYTSNRLFTDFDARLKIKTTTTLIEGSNLYYTSNRLYTDFDNRLAIRDTSYINELNVNNLFFNNTTNLIAWYKFDGNLNDSSLNNKTLTAYNGNFDSNLKKIGSSSYSFNNLNSYLECPVSGSYFTPTNMTISVWIYGGSSYTDHQSIASARNVTGGTNVSGWMLYITPNTEQLTFWYGGGNPNIWLQYDFSVSDFIISSTTTKWRHIVITIDSSKNIKLYIDGVYKNGGIMPGTFIYSANNLRIGTGACESEGRYYLNNGTKLDDFRIYNRVLTSTEVNTLYNQSLITNTYLYYTTDRLNSNFDINLNTKSTTSRLIEGSNLYYTSDRLYTDFDDRLNTKTTDDFIEGSNLYYETSRHNSNFDLRFNAKTTDYLTQGTSNVYMTSSTLSMLFGQKDTNYLSEGNINRYIVNDVYNGNITVTNSLTTSNLIVIGTKTTLNSTTYILNKLDIDNHNSNVPALYIKQLGTTGNPLTVYKHSKLLFNITNNSNVAIKRLKSKYSPLNNSGSLGSTVNITNLNNATIDNINYIRGDGSVSFNGTNQYVDLSPNINLYGLYNKQITTGLSISSWVKIPSQPIDTQGGGSASSLQYFYGSYCSDGEYILRQFPSKSTTSMNDLITNMINNPSYVGIVVYDYTTYWEVSYIPSGIIPTVYNRRTSVATWGDALNRHIYIHIARATAASVYVNQSYATIQSYTPASPASLVELWKMADGAIGTNPNNYIAIQKKAGITNTLNFVINSSSYSALSKVVLDNTWHHIVWCISSTGVWSIYIDNTYINPSITASITNATFTKMWLARSEFGGSYLLGNIDDFRIYNKALTATEVGYLYNNNNSFVINTTNLPIWYEFNNTISSKQETTISSTYDLDVNGIVNAPYLIGAGNNLSNIYLKDKDTSFLNEGSNLYYTDERAQNVVNNFTNLIFNRTSDLLEGSNLYYTTERYSNIFENKFPTITTDYLKELKSTSVLTNGLLIWYKFENNLLDSSGNNNHGVDVNGNLLFTTSSTYVKEGKYAIQQFDNYGGASTRYYTSSKTFDITTSGFSICFWGQTSLYSQWKTYVACHGSGNIRITPHGQNQVFVILGEEYATTYVLSNGMLVSNMNHYVVVFNYSPAKWDFYCNGILQTTYGTQERGPGGPYPLYTGLKVWSKCYWDNYSINGYLDDLRMYSRSLTISEVQTLYNSAGGGGSLSSGKYYHTTSNYYTAFDNSLATSNTTRLSEGSNLYYTTQRLNDDFDNSVSSNNTFNTSLLKLGSNLYYTCNLLYTDFDYRFNNYLRSSNLLEGSNLYFSDINHNFNFDKRLSQITIDNLYEGTSNLYYTDDRFSFNLFDKKTTNILQEGSSNLYFKDYRVNELINTGFINRTSDHLDENFRSSNLYYKTNKRYIDFDNKFKTINSDLITEGSNNLYYIQSRETDDFNNIFSSKTTDYLNQGTSNLYYNDTKVAVSLNNILSNNYINNSINTINNIYPADTYNIIDNKVSIETVNTDRLLEGTSNLYFTPKIANINFKNNLKTSNTDNLQEGSNNLYYTPYRFYTDFDNRLNIVSTNFLNQGSNNIYYTTELFNSNFDTKINYEDVARSNIIKISKNLLFFNKDYLADTLIYSNSNLEFELNQRVYVPNTIVCGDMQWSNIPAFTTSNSVEYLCLYSDFINSNIITGLLDPYTTSNVIKNIMISEDIFITTSNANVQISPYITSNNLKNLLQQNDFISSNILVNIKDSYSQSNNLNTLLLYNKFFTSNMLKNILINTNNYLYNVLTAIDANYINIIKNNFVVSNPYKINNGYSYINYSNLIAGSNSITFTKNTLCDILLVGSGNGEIVYKSNQLLSKGTYTIDLYRDSIIKNSLNNIIYSAKSNYSNYIIYGIGSSLSVFNLDTHVKYTISLGLSYIDMYIQTIDKRYLYIIGINSIGKNSLYKYDIIDNISTLLCVFVQTNDSMRISYAFLNSDETLLYYTYVNNNGNGIYRKSFYINLNTLIITEVPFLLTSYSSLNYFVMSNDKTKIYHAVDGNYIEVINITDPNNAISIARIQIPLDNFSIGAYDAWGLIYVGGSILAITISENDDYVYVLSQTKITVINCKTNIILSTSYIGGFYGSTWVSGWSMNKPDFFVTFGDPISNAAYVWQKNNSMTIYNNNLVLITPLYVKYYNLYQNNVGGLSAYYSRGDGDTNIYGSQTALSSTTIVRVLKTSSYPSSNISITGSNLTYSGSNGSISGLVIIKYPNLDILDSEKRVDFNKYTISDDIYTSNLRWYNSPYFITSNSISSIAYNTLSDYITSNNQSNLLLGNDYITSNNTINTLSDILIPYITSNTVDDVILNHTFFNSNIFFSSLSDNYKNIITSSKIKEGSNLYHTTERLSYDIDTKYTNITSSELTEGSNLYYTYDRTVNDFNNRFNSKSTSDLKGIIDNMTSGSNLYYTYQLLNTDLDDKLKLINTSIITEGSNLYYTSNRVYDAFDNRISTKTTNLLNLGSNLYYTSQKRYIDFDNKFINVNTSYINEGSNLYYISSRTQDDYNTILYKKNTNDVIAASFTSTSSYLNTTYRIAGTISNNWLGESLAISYDGSVIISGSPDYTGTGSVSFFQYKNSTWTRTLKVEGAANEQFGLRVDISGDGLTAVIGGPYYDSGRGRAIIYRWYNNEWNQSSQINGTLTTDKLGSSISISGDGNVIAVSLLGYGSYTGSVKIYKWNGTIWNDTYQFYGNASLDYFGGSISLSYDGSILTICGYGYSSNKGKIFFYNWDGTTWTKTFEYVGITGLLLGNDVAMSGDGNTAVVIGNSSVVIFKKNGSSWVKSQELSEGQSAGRVAISYDGIYIMIGKQYDNSYNGKVLLYNYNGTSWVLNTQYNGSGSEYAGTDVAISADGGIKSYGSGRYDPGGMSYAGSVTVIGTLTTSLIASQSSNIYYSTNLRNADFDKKFYKITTSRFNEGSNLYYTSEHLSDYLDMRLNDKSTSIIKEGSNLYYTSNRSYNYLNINLSNLNTSIFNTGSNLYYNLDLINNDIDNRFNTISTSLLTEGSNLYYNLNYANDTLNNKLITITTSDFNEGSNLYYTTSNYNNDFDNILTAKSTSIINEGSNLYYNYNNSIDRLTSNLNNLNSSILPEGSNLYYTLQKLEKDLNNSLGSNNTSIIVEGSNLYYQSYQLLDNFNSNYANLYTTTLNEGSNLYYIQSRTIDDINNILYSKNTSELQEGSNLYFTDERFDIVFNNSLTRQTNISSNSTTELQEGSNLYYRDDVVDLYILNNTEKIYNLSTTDIIEGSNLYYDNNRTIDILYSNINNITTSELQEGSNQYYNDNRFNTISSDNILEGSNNKYIINNIYNTDLTVNGLLTINVLNILDIDLINSSNLASNILYSDEKVNNAYTKSISYSTDNILGGTSNKYYDNINLTNDFNNILSFKSTDNLLEGSNIYYNINLLSDALNNILVNTNIINEGTSNYYYNDGLIYNKLDNINTDEITNGTSNIYLDVSLINNKINITTTDDIMYGNSNNYYNIDNTNTELNTLYNSCNLYGKVVDGWDNSLSIYRGFKCNVPFYLALYLSQNIQTGLSNISFIIPFEIDYNSDANMNNSILLSSNYWYNNHFVAPVKGMYSINYSLITDTYGYTWLNKNSDIINQSYNIVYSSKYISAINAPVVSTINVFATNIVDEYYFIYKPLSDNSYIYNNLTNENNIGNTKASILLLQETI